MKDSKIILKIIPRRLRKNRGLRRLLKNRMAVVGGIITSLYLFMAVFAPILMPYDPIKMELRHSLEPPNGANLLGRDQLGRDILSRIISGSRMSLIITVGVLSIAFIIGVLLGTISGYYEGWIDGITMRIIDILLAFPSILLALVIISVIGTGLNGVMITVGITSMPYFARIVRGVVLSVKENQYVEAARAIGENDLNLIVRYVLPNCLGPILVQLTLRMATIILTVASMSFLGLGVQPPTPEWGTMISEGRAFLQSAPHVVIFPGLAIMLVVFGLNLLGDGLRDAFDPRLQID